MQQLYDCHWEIPRRLAQNSRFTLSGNGTKERWFSVTKSRALAQSRFHLCSSLSSIAIKRRVHNEFRRFHGQPNHADTSALSPISYSRRYLQQHLARYRTSREALNMGMHSLALETHRETRFHILFRPLADASWPLLSASCFHRPESHVVPATKFETRRFSIPRFASSSSCNYPGRPINAIIPGCSWK